MEQPSITLNSGREIPQVGFGVYLIWDHGECKRAVLDALAAGAVVTKDVPSNCVVAGVPAKVVRQLEG